MRYSQYIPKMVKTKCGISITGRCLSHDLIVSQHFRLQENQISDNLLKIAKGNAFSYQWSECFCDMKNLFGFECVIFSLEF